MHVSCTKLEYVKTAFTKTPRSWSEEVSIQMKACVEPLNQHIKINDGNILLLSRENVQQMSFMIKELFLFASRQNHNGCNIVLTLFAFCNLREEPKRTKLK